MEKQFHGHFLHVKEYGTAPLGYFSSSFFKKVTKSELVRHVVEGLMGLEPEMERGMISTHSRLPEEIGRVTLHRQNIGVNQITLTHIGRRVSILRNLAGKRIRWTAGFVGRHEIIFVNNQPISTTICEKCGILFSEVTVSVEEDREIRIELPL